MTCFKAMFGMMACWNVVECLVYFKFLYYWHFKFVSLFNCGVNEPVYTDI